MEIVSVNVRRPGGKVSDIYGLSVDRFRIIHEATQSQDDDPLAGLGFSP